MYVKVVSYLDKTRFNLLICNISTLKKLAACFIILNVINETEKDYKRLNKQKTDKTRFDLQICNISTLKNLVGCFIILDVINATGRRYDIDK